MDMEDIEKVLLPTSESVADTADGSTSVEEVPTGENNEATVGFTSSPAKKGETSARALKRQVTQASATNPNDDLNLVTSGIEEIPVKVSVLERNATVLFGASLPKKSEPDIAKRRLRLRRQMSKPTMTVSLSWSELTAVAPGAQPSLWERAQGIDAKHPDKVILNNVSGIAMPGQLIAIMGVSGVGKTTLLNVLASQNLSSLKITGSVRLDGEVASASDIHQVSAYVQQEEFYIGTMKVIEHLKFQAALRLDKKFSNKDKLERIEQVMFEMGLHDCQDTLIGIPGKLKGISGGEKKRLSIASQLLKNRPLLLLDEPTSGLDSFMTESVVKLLQKVTATGRTVLCSIHQPSSAVYALFDHVILLAEGRIAYLGPTCQTSQFFAEAGYECPENYYPADFYIHTLAIVPGSEEECKENVKAICDAFETSNLGDNVREEINEERSRAIKEMNGEHQFNVPRKSYNKQRCTSSVFTQLRYVVWRSWLSLIREPLSTRIRCLKSIGFAILLGLTFLQLDLDESSVQNIAGALSYAVIIETVGNEMSIVQRIPTEMPVLLREHRSRLYTAPVYIIAKSLADLPLVFVFELIFSIIMYPMIGLRSGVSHFLAFYGVLVLGSLAAMSLGYCISAAAPSVAVIASLSTVFYVPFLLFGGFYQRSSSVKSYMLWMKFLSWVYYGFEILMVNQWAGYNLDKFNATNGECTATTGTVKICRGDDVLEFFGLDANNVGRNIGLLFVFMFGFRLLAIIILTMRMRNSKN